MTINNLPFSQACENNKGPILSVLATAFKDCRSILEIGSGTGQHAVHFADHLPHAVWQASEQPAYIDDLAARIVYADLANLPPPIILDVLQKNMPAQLFQGVFTANTLHIMSWQTVCKMFERLVQITQAGSTLCIYGPFNYNGTFTSASNAAFDASLRSRDHLMGIRNIDAVLALALQHRFVLEQDIAMPANNRLLWFIRYE